jgi:dTDP-4-dehydrorhamnose reductase
MEQFNNNNLKILVTGANGQLGRCLQDVAKKYPDYDFHFKTSKELDITTKEKIRSLFEQEKFEYCINCAAYTAVDRAETERDSAFLVNAEAVKYLAEACKENETILIHISTDFVFDGSKTTPYSEEDIPNPLNVYGASKLKGEQYVQEIWESYFIIRTSWVYSEYGHNFVKTMLRLGAERKELSVVIDQIGSPTSARDLAEVIMIIINSKSTKYGLYHYGNDGELSWFDFARAIFAESKSDVKLITIKTKDYPTLAKRPLYSVLVKNKITNKLNIEIPFWEESLKKTLLSLNTKNQE